MMLEGLLWWTVVSASPPLGTGNRWSLRLRPGQRDDSGLWCWWRQLCPNQQSDPQEPHSFTQLAGASPSACGNWQSRIMILYRNIELFYILQTILNEVFISNSCRLTKVMKVVQRVPMRPTPRFLWVTSCISMVHLSQSVSRYCHIIK